VDPTRRFSSRVEDYVRYRPSYPAGIVPLLERECGLHRNSVVADIGSGTGLSSKMFLELGCQVVGVEPNSDMRQAGDLYLSEFPRFQSVDGRAEQTGLADMSVDLITAGQAFHWFDAEAAWAEFSRILRPPRWVVLIWNERVVPDHGFLRGYEDLLHRYATDYSKVDHRRIDAPQLDEFFGQGKWKQAVFNNHQDFDLTGAAGRLLSSSYIPREGSATHLPMMDELERLFSGHHSNGRIRFIYETKVYCGTLA
jgi:SAM-dependent methyltransferase